MFLGQLPGEQVAAIREALIDSVVAGHGADVSELPVEVIVSIGRRR